MSGVFENQVRPARLEQASKGERVGDEVGEVSGGPDQAGLVCCGRTLNFILSVIGSSGGRVGAEEGSDLNCENRRVGDK